LGVKKREALANYSRFARRDIICAQPYLDLLGRPAEQDGLDVGGKRVPLL
jgi:hypothetical protein